MATMTTRSNATFEHAELTFPADTVETPAVTATDVFGRAQHEISSVSLKVPRPRVIAGKYRLDRLLGEGGMGTIWRAFNLQLEVQVAIKLLRPRQRSAELAERLRSEARVAARLVHPSIVRVFDVSESEAGEPFIVMELLEGESLADMLGRGWLSPITVVRLLLPIAEALAVAHARGIVHRDLKPDNVFVTPAGRTALPKLLDFGIAKIEGIESDCHRKLTLAGTLLGSPDYMSPEQVACRPDVDHRSDIWSFCIMLYEALSGHPPFSGATFRSLLHSISEDAPPTLELVGIDPKLARIVRQGLEKDRERRPASISELGRALASWAVEQGVVYDAAGSSLAAKWLDRPWEIAPGGSSALTPATSAPEAGITLASKGHHAPEVQPRWRWSTALAAATAAAALVAWVTGSLTGASALPVSRSPSEPLRTPAVLIRGIDQGCSPPAATPALALAPPANGEALFSYSSAPRAATVRAPTAKDRVAVRAHAKPANAGSGRRPKVPLPF